jgi:hypothetical protein
MAAGTITLEGLSPENISGLLKRLLDEASREDIQSIDLNGLATISVHIPGTKLQSQITPAYMEAFLELQKQLFQLAAFVKTGVANAGHLDDSDKEKLEIAVTVTGGSSDYLADITDKLEGLGKILVNKLNGRQAVIVILGIAVLVTGGLSFRAYIDSQAEIKTQELKSTEHIVALEKLAHANDEQRETIKEVIAALEQQGEVGLQAIKLAEATNEALLKAASKTAESTINGVTISGAEAELLRQNPRKQSETHLETQIVTVTGISMAGNTDQFSLLLSNPNEEHKVTLPETLFSSEDRVKLYAALQSRSSILVELQIKLVDNQIRSVEFLRVVPPRQSEN